MPLIKSSSDKAVGKNITTEMSHGKPHKQAVAIALAVQERAKQAEKNKNPQAAELQEYAESWKDD